MISLVNLFFQDILPFQTKNSKINPPGPSSHNSTCSHYRPTEYMHTVYICTDFLVTHSHSSRLHPPFQNHQNICTIIQVNLILINLILSRPFCQNLVILNLSGPSEWNSLSKIHPSKTIHTNCSKFQKSQDLLVYCLNSNLSGPFSNVWSNLHFPSPQPTTLKYICKHRKFNSIACKCHPLSVVSSIYLHFDFWFHIHVSYSSSLVTFNSIF